MKSNKLIKSVSRGQRVFFCGHSFSYFVPPILNDIAISAGFNDNKVVGESQIGGSQVIRHWDVPEEQNDSKKSLIDGKVDVLALAPIYLRFPEPDEGIEKYAGLALEHNPEIRITVQEIWLRWDIYEPSYPPFALFPQSDWKAPEQVDHNAVTGVELRKRHAPLFKSIDDYVRELNSKLGKQVLFVIPAGQAVIALREKVIAGKAPGLQTQEDLFLDPVGHPAPPLQALVAYCYFAVIYQQNPAGLPMPFILTNAKNPGWDEKLNRLLQEISWDAVVHHPLSGVPVKTNL